MGILVYSLLWVLQGFYQQPYGLGLRAEKFRVEFRV